MTKTTEETEVKVPEVEVQKELGVLFDSTTDVKESDSEDAWLLKHDKPDPDVVVEETAAEKESTETQAEKLKVEEVTETLSEEDQEAYQKALSALRMDNYETEELDGMSREQVLKLGERAAKRQAKTSKALQERADEIKALKESKATEEAEHVSAEPTATKDLTDLLKPLQDEYGDTLTGPLGKVLNGVLSNADARVKQAELAIEHGKQALADRTSLLEQTVYELSRQRLVERFPEMNDPQRWQEVAKKANGFDVNEYVTEGGTVFTAAEGMVRDAAKLLGLKDTLVASKETESNEEASIRDQSTPTARSETVPPKAMTADQKEDWILARLEDPNDGRDWKALQKAAGF